MYNFNSCALSFKFTLLEFKHLSMSIENPSPKLLSLTNIVPRPSTVRNAASSSVKTGNDCDKADTS